MASGKRQTGKPGSTALPRAGGREGEAMSFGTWLRQQREMREVSLREIADATKVSLRYLEALEQDRFDILPAPVFARGFLRQYARYVGLNADEVVNAYLIAEQGDEEEDESAMERGGRRRRQLPPATLLGVGAVLLVVVAALAFYVGWPREARPARPVPAEPRAGSGGAPGAAPAEPAAPPAPARDFPLLVTLDFTGDCWVDATVDGERRLAELRVQGESLQLAAEEHVALLLGDPGAVHVEVNGEPFPVPPAPPGEPARLEIRPERAGEGGEGETPAPEPGPPAPGGAGGAR